MIKPISDAADPDSVARALAAKIDFKDQFILSNEIGIAGGDGLPKVSYYNTVKNDGPVAYWRLGEVSGVVAVDDIGVLNADGTYTSGGLGPTLGQPALIAGDSDTSVLFDSTNTEYVANCGQVDDFSFIQNSLIFTIELWVKHASLPGTQWYLSTNGTGSSSSTKGISIIHEGGTNHISVQATRSVLSSWPLFINSSNDAVNDLNAHHVVVTCNGVNGFIYVDGVQVGTSAVGPVSTGDSTDELDLAAAGGVSPLNGTMDESAFYDKFFTPSIVLAHYNAGI